MMAMVLLLAQAAPSPPVAIDLAAGTIAAIPSVPSRCSTGASDDIVVCGDRRNRYRLPLPVERSHAPLQTIGGTGMAGLTANAPCGIFAGQRRCTKREAAAYGYGNGRDPVSVATKLVKAATGKAD